jgi:hypothetical protein
MNKTKKIEIKISKEKLELLRQFGLSPEDVFVKGYESLLRQKYKELSLVDDDDEDQDEIEWVEIGEISKRVHEIDDFFVGENDINNN